MQLETLITQLGITEHMEALSDWRDAFLIEKAAELQVLQQKHDALELAQAGIDEDRSELATLRPLKTLHDTMVVKVQASLRSGKPEDFVALAQDFLADPIEKRRAELLAELATLPE